MQGSNKRDDSYYLLNGWTMMAEGCSKCLHPLYHDRKRTNKIMCATCDEEVVIPSYSKAVAVSSGSTSEGKLGPKTGSDLSKSQSNLAASIGEDDEYEDEKFENKFFGGFQKKSAPSMQDSSSLYSRSTGKTSASCEISDSVKVLLAKIKTCSDRLELTDDIVEQENLCNQISLFSDTIKKLNRAQNSIIKTKV